MTSAQELRAMRAAKFARAREVAGEPPMVPTPPANQTRKAEAAKAAPVAPPTAASTSPATDELCGHKNMSGRTCTREKGHAAKSHRYS